VVHTCTYTYVCRNKFDNIEIHMHVHTHISQVTTFDNIEIHIHVHTNISVDFNIIKFRYYG
jgi:hypothetical protein